MSNKKTNPKNDVHPTHDSNILKDNAEQVILIPNKLNEPEKYAESIGQDLVLDKNQKLKYAVVREDGENNVDLWENSEERWEENGKKNIAR